MQNMNSETKQWLLDRNISEETLHRFDIHESNGSIVIPIKDLDGNLLFNKYRCNPHLADQRVKYWYDKNGFIALFNPKALQAPNEDLIVITEGELDALVLESNGISAVSSTGGASSFQKHWKDLFKDKTNIIICLDADEAGLKGAIKIQQILPQARMLVLPYEKGVKDITDYFKRHDVKKFLALKATTYFIPEDIKTPYTPKDLRIKIKELEAASEAILAEARNGQREAHHEMMLELIEEKNSEHKRLLQNFAKREKYEGSDELARAKSVPIERFLIFDQTGKARCIWHNEDTGSLHYYREKNKVYCFGCSESGDVIDVVMTLQKMTLGQAIKYLNE